MKRLPWSVLLIWWLAAQPLPVHADATSLLVRDCSALIREDYDPHAALKSKRRFEKIPRRQLRQKLEAALSSVPVGSNAYQSVAYALIYYRIDVKENLPLLFEGAPQLKSYQDVSGVAEGIYNRLDYLYRRDRSKDVLAILLSHRSDGAGASSVRFARLGLLVDFPHTILCSVVRTPRNYRIFLYDLENQGTEKELATLRRMRESKFKAVRRAAELGLRKLEINLSQHQPH
jgi:hypothetical protein